MRSFLTFLKRGSRQLKPDTASLAGASGLPCPGVFHMTDDPDTLRQIIDAQAKALRTGRRRYIFDAGVAHGRGCVLTGLE